MPGDCNHRLRQQLHVHAGIRSCVVYCGVRSIQAVPTCKLYHQSLTDLGRKSPIQKACYPTLTSTYETLFPSFASKQGFQLYVYIAVFY